MLLEVIESMKESINTTIAYSNLAIWGWTYAKLKESRYARKEGMFHGKIISSHVVVKTVNNYSQFWKQN